MADIKFSGDERDPVIERLETLKNIKLKPVGRSKKFLKGSDELYYCIVGGTGDWHAILKEVMHEEERDKASVYLVIARWLRTKIEIYGGLMKPLFESRGSLSRNQKGDFQFNLKTPTDGILSIKEVAEAKFEKLDEFSAPPVSRFKTLSEEKQRELLRKAGLK
jgi:hypothetical protein